MRRHPHSPPPEPSPEALEAGIQEFRRILRHDMMFGECSHAMLRNIVRAVWQRMYEVEAAEAPPSPITELTVRVNKSVTHHHHVTSRSTTAMSTATLNWVLPTTRVDGSPLSAGEIALIDIFDSLASDPNTPITSIQGAATSFTTDTLVPGDHTFTAVVQDTAGHRSEPSGAATGTVAEPPPPPVANPSPITGLTVTINP